MTKISLKKKLLPSLVATALVAGVALSNSASAIQVAANDVGQLLLAPIYSAKTADERTLLTIVNNSTTHAVKVKAVFRSRKYSTEVLDFLIFLTPGDVWRGEVYNKDGQAWLRSKDDSVRNLPRKDSFGSVQQADVQLFDQSLRKDSSGKVIDDNEMGHIEFIGHYSVAPNVPIRVSVGSPNPITISRGMSKFDVARLMEMYTGEISNLNPTICPPNDANYPGISNPTCPVRVDDPANLQISGEVELINAGGRIVYPMTALASSRLFETTKLLNPVPFDAADVEADGWFNPVREDNTFPTTTIVGTHVIANPFLNIDTSTATMLGANWGYSRGEIMGPVPGWNFNDEIFGVYDNILEIEHALATSAAVGSYENGVAYEGMAGVSRYTGIQVTFPTKYRHEGDVCNTGLVVNKTLGQFYPPFTLNGDVTFKMVSFDNSENTITNESSVSGGSEKEFVITDEVNLLLGSTSMPLFSYPSGAYHIRYQATSNGDNRCPYKGVPAITKTYKYLADSAGEIGEQVFIPASADAWRWQ